MTSLVTLRSAQRGAHALLQHSAQKSDPPPPKNRNRIVTTAGVVAYSPSAWRLGRAQARASHVLFRPSPRPSVS